MRHLHSRCRADTHGFRPFSCCTAPTRRARADSASSCREAALQQAQQFVQGQTVLMEQLCRTWATGLTLTARVGQCKPMCRGISLGTAHWMWAKERRPGAQQQSAAVTHMLAQPSVQTSQRWWMQCQQQQVSRLQGSCTPILPGWQPASQRPVAPGGSVPCAQGCSSWHPRRYLSVVSAGSGQIPVGGS